MKIISTAVINWTNIPGQSYLDKLNFSMWMPSNATFSLLNSILSTKSVFISICHSTAASLAKKIWHIFSFSWSYFSLPNPLCEGNFTCLNSAHVQFKRTVACILPENFYVCLFHIPYWDDDHGFILSCCLGAWLIVHIDFLYWFCTSSLFRKFSHKHSQS